MLPIWRGNITGGSIWPQGLPQILLNRPSQREISCWGTWTNTCTWAHKSHVQARVHHALRIASEALHRRHPRARFDKAFGNERAAPAGFLTKAGLVPPGPGQHHQFSGRSLKLAGRRIGQGCRTLSEGQASEVLHPRVCNDAGAGGPRCSG